MREDLKFQFFSCLKLLISYKVQHCHVAGQFLSAFTAQPVVFKIAVDDGICRSKADVQLVSYICDSNLSPKLEH